MSADDDLYPDRRPNPVPYIASYAVGFTAAGLLIGGLTAELSLHTPINPPPRATEVGLTVDYFALLNIVLGFYGLVLAYILYQVSKEGSA